MPKFIAVAWFAAFILQTTVCVADDRLSIIPADIQLNGQQATHQFLVLLDDSSGHHDATATATITSEDPEVAFISSGKIIPKSNGTTQLTTSLNGIVATASVTVSNIETRHPTGFHSDVLAALNKSRLQYGGLSWISVWKRRISIIFARLRSGTGSGNTAR